MISLEVWQEPSARGKNTRFSVHSFGIGGCRGIALNQVSKPGACGKDGRSRVGSVSHMSICRSGVEASQASPRVTAQEGVKTLRVLM